MEQNIGISILIPTYSRVGILPQTLQSVLGQGSALEHAEIIISNDCSKDRTAELLENFKTQNPHLNISIFNHEKNLGGPGNWQFLLEQAKGEFVFLLSDDDWIAPEFLKNYLEVMRTHPDVDIIYSAFDFRDENMNHLLISQISSQVGLQAGVFRVYNQLQANHMVMSAMYRKKTLLTAGGWQAQYGTCLDGAAFALACVNSRQTYFINKPLFIYRIGSQTWSSFKVEKQKQFYLWFRKIIDHVILEVEKRIPENNLDFKKAYKFYPQGVLNMLDIKIVHGNLKRADLFKLLKDLALVYPEVFALRSFYKMGLVALFGPRWLVLLRKVLNKPEIRGTSVFEANMELKGNK
jgi:glycosyltransferase involved in cell wall biosynthesis